MKNINKFVIVIMIAFFLNLIWEILHYQLYYDLSGISKYPHILLASFTDAIIICLILLFVSLKNKSIKWINKPGKTDYFVIVTLGLLIAASVELWALHVGRWQYTPSMPIIFAIGLSPLLQLAATATLSLIIIKSHKK